MLGEINFLILQIFLIKISLVKPIHEFNYCRILFEELLKFHGSRHATSVNLMTCMGSIVIIAKLRPSFMGRVVTAIEKLNGKCNHIP